MKFRILTALIFSSMSLGLYAAKTEKLQGISFFSPRSLGTNAVRDAIALHPFIHKPDHDHRHGFFSVTSGFSHSVRAQHIAQTLFGTDRLIITGSQVAQRGPSDILADYFGLSPDFQSVVTLDPIISTAFLTFDGYVGFSHGLYLRVTIPAAWTKWKLQLEEQFFDRGTSTPFPANYMTMAALQAPEASFIEAMQGDTTFGHMQEKLKFGKIACRNTTNDIADVHFVFGWDIVKKEYGHVGINLRAVAPTGTRSKSEFLFEPMIGNGHHAEFGIGIDGHIRVWEKDGEQDLSLYTVLNGMHIFASRQCRSFDLCNNGFASRYMLMKEFDESGAYTGNLSPVINQTTLPCKVHVDLQLDMLFMFGYTYNDFVCDIGYNGWIRSHEKISLCKEFPINKFGLKGIQNVVTPTNQLSATTQSTATIFGDAFADQNTVADAISPRLISPNDINTSSAASPRLITHKLFFHLGWSRLDDEKRYTPFLGFGSEIEFEGINRNNTAQPDRTTLSQWSIWIKGGLAIN